MNTEANHSTAPAEPKPKRSKGGAPATNANAMRHGLRAGKLPPGCGWITSLVAEFRTSLEAAVVASRGEINIVDAAAISTACRWERHALLAQRWLRVDFDNLELSERLAYSREVATASASRDKAMEKLGLDHHTTDLWAAAINIEAEPKTLGAAEPASPTTERLATGSHLASQLTHSQANPPVESNGSQIVDSGASGEAERGIPVAGVVATDT